MKRYLFVLIVALGVPSTGMGQVAGDMPSPWRNVLSVDVNLAFGPSSTATWDPSIGFRFGLNDHFRVGIGDVSFGGADVATGTRYAIMGGPVVEYTSLFASNFSYSILAGIPLQNRWGAQIPHGFGAAPYGAAAVDYLFTPGFAFAGLVRVQYIATDTYLRSPRVLPSSAIVIGFGIGFHFYF
jgi:hypothetical protein